eukprot:TRINITY_DN559_c0_g1_i2.p1 TRINITY_DN559_c0_g1~~TRINITY_DN559_c0_g1_i2.p1  ORF type:complete len:160 (+),score=26.53 TRINITY_DN559_c0_g1_i2:95-574(+)
MSLVDSSYVLKVAALAVNDVATKPEALVSLSLATIDKAGKSKRWFKTSKKAASGAKWREPFEILVDSKVKVFKITCWDKTKGKVFLGEISLPTSKLSEFTPELAEATFPFVARAAKDKKDVDVTGNLSLQVAYFPKPAYTGKNSPSTPRAVTMLSLIHI